MRNFNDKAYVKDMMCNIVNFLVEFGYPDQMVSIKELQKIDKQSFINFFNVINCRYFIWMFYLIFCSLLQFINQFLDRNFQLAARFSEDELIKYVKNLGYGGTLTKAALVSSNNPQFDFSNIAVDRLFSISWSTSFNIPNNWSA